MNQPFWRQLWIVSGVLVDFICQGMVLSYPSCLIPALRADNSPVKLNLNTESWLGSIIATTLVPGNLLVPVFMESFGRRWIHASACFLQSCSWLLQYRATDLYTFMLARMLAGVCVSSSQCSGSIVIAEYTSPEYRGLFLSVKTFAMLSGYFLMHVLGHYLHFRTVALVGALVCAVGFFCNLTWPESPSWLLLKNRFDECEKIFFWLRGRDVKVVAELEAMVRAQKLRMSTRVKGVSYSSKLRNLFMKFKEKTFLKPLAIVFFAMAVKEACGRNFFPTYALDIMSQVSADKADHFFYIIVIDVVSLVTTAVSCTLVKLVGRRTLFMLSGIPAVLVLIVLSSSLFLVSRGILNVEPWHIPTLLCLFFVLTNFGCTSLPLVVYGEIFPLTHREVGAGIGGCFMALTFFASMKAVPYLLAYAQLCGTLAVFAIILTMSLTYLYFALPETRNKTLHEIEEFFEHGKFLDCNDVELREPMLVENEKKNMKS